MRDNDSYGGGWTWGSAPGVCAEIREVIHSGLVGDCKRAVKESQQINWLFFVGMLSGLFEMLSK